MLHPYIICVTHLVCGLKKKVQILFYVVLLGTNDLTAEGRSYDEL